MWQYHTTLTHTGHRDINFPQHDSLCVFFVVSWDESLVLQSTVIWTLPSMTLHVLFRWFQEMNPFPHRTQWFGFSRAGLFMRLFCVVPGHETLATQRTMIWTLSSIKVIKSTGHFLTKGAASIVYYINQKGWTWWKWPKITESDQDIVTHRPKILVLPFEEISLQPELSSPTRFRIQGGVV